MRNYAALSTAFAILAAAPLAAAAPPPTVTKVKITGSAGAYAATISGKSFGAAPAGVPCNACAIAEFGLTATHNIFASLAYNITAWTSTKITLTGINGAAGDAVFADIKPDGVQNVATWGGNFPGGSGNPVITSVSFSGSGAATHITISGHGFGAAPTGVPGTGNTPFLNFVQYNVKTPMQYNYPWGAGWAAQGISDTATLDYTSWTDTQIVVSGFAGAYGTNGFVTLKHDPYFIWLWTPPGQNPGSTGPQTAFGGRIP